MCDPRRIDVLQSGKHHDFYILDLYQVHPFVTHVLSIKPTSKENDVTPQ